MKPVHSNKTERMACIIKVFFKKRFIIKSKNIYSSEIFINIQMNHKVPPICVPPLNNKDIQIFFRMVLYDHISVTPPLQYLYSSK